MIETIIAALARSWSSVAQRPKWAARNRTSMPIATEATSSLWMNNWVNGKPDRFCVTGRERWTKFAISLYPTHVHETAFKLPRGRVRVSLDLGCQGQHQTFVQRRGYQESAKGIEEGAKAGKWSLAVD